MLSALALCLSLASFPASASAAATAAELWTPKAGACPANFSLVRDTGVANVNQTLSIGEAAFISSRRSNVLPGAFKSYLTNVQNTNIALPDYIQSVLSGTNGSLPTLGIAVSGGAYRAAMFGAGVMNSIDGRNATAVKLGTGGLLQAASYTTGLSGGSWLVYTLAAAGFPTMQELILGPANPTDSGYGGWTTSEFGTLSLDAAFNNTAEDTTYEAQLVAEISGKMAAGYPVTIVDLLSRALARHFLNGTTNANFFDNTTSVHGAGTTFSELVNV